MSNLYKPNQQQHQPVGSFDDYDSIVDEFQFPTDHGNNSQYSDVSSMHMSEMGGVSVAAAANSPARSARSNVTPTRNTIGGGENEESDGDGNGVGSPLQFLPSHLVAVNNNNNAPPTTRGGGEQLNNSTGNVSEGSSFKLDVDASGYYHVGDYRVGDLGIDTTDVSAILGVASDDVLDEESLLAHAGDNGSSLPTVEDYKKSNVKKLLRKKNKMMSNSNRGDKYEVMNQQQQENGNVNHRSIGPLGDDLSYADGAPNNAMPSSSYPSNDYDLDSDDDDEDEINEGILPNWIAFSSQKSKCIFVSSTALILGSLVLAIVALGVSYGTGSLLINDNENNNNNGGIESDGGGVSGVQVVPPPTNSDTGGLITTTTIGPTLMPTSDALYLVTDAPVSSTTGEGDNESSEPPKPTTTTTDSPTLEPTSIGTSPIEATTATSIPTVPSRLEPSIVFVSPTVPAVPITTSPTLKLVEPSSSPITTTETFTESPISSIIDNVISTEPTLSPVTQTSMIPSMNPTSKPSTSTKPSWSFGTESTDGGDVTFYLMADGGSNFRFWSEKLRVLNLEDDQKFMVHLGSAIRAVDNCESTAYLRTQLSLSVSPIPVYSLPGNNDYPECDDPIQGWANYEEHMMNLDTMYWNTTDEEYEYDVKRQTNIDRDENFSFLYKRVLFIGLNMVTNDIDENDTAKRLDENINWVIDNANAYSTNVDVIFVMGYGRLMATENEPFYNAMVNLTSSSKSEEEDGTGGGVGGEWSDKLLIYARRASETDIEYDIGGNSNFAELRVGNEWPILDVRIRTKGKDAPLIEYRDVVEDDEDEPKML